MTLSRKASTRYEDDRMDGPSDGRGTVPIECIEPNPEQPRQRFDSTDEAGLAESIRRHGVLQPLLITPSPGCPDRFILVAGERRWRAARAAGLKEVPVTIIAANSQRCLEVALVENLQRADLGPLERARAYRGMIDDFGMTQAQVAEAVGVSRSVVANTLRLQKLDAEMQQALAEGRISESHGRTLVGISDDETRRRLFLRMLTGRLNLRQAEQAARRTLKPRPTPDVELEHVAERLQWRLGTRVRFVGTRKRGRIQIEYRDPEDLDVLLEMLLPE